MSRDARSPPSLSAVSRHDDAKRQKQESPGASVNVKSCALNLHSGGGSSVLRLDGGDALVENWAVGGGNPCFFASLPLLSLASSKTSNVTMMMYPIYEDFNCSRSKNYSLFRVNFASKSKC